MDDVTVAIVDGNGLDWRAGRYDRGRSAVVSVTHANPLLFILKMGAEQYS